MIVSVEIDRNTKTDKRLCKADVHMYLYSCSEIDYKWKFLISEGVKLTKIPNEHNSS